MLLVALVFLFAAPIYSFATSRHMQPAQRAPQFYLRWRREVLTAKSVDEITPFWTAEVRDEFSMEPESARAETLRMAKRFLAMQTNVRVVREAATPTGATLSLEGRDADNKPIVSSVDIVKENG